MDPKRPKTAWSAVLLFGLAYLACAEAGHVLSLRAVTSTFATFWPPAGLYVCGLLIAAPASRNRLILAAVAANLLSDVALHGQPLRISFGYCLANTLEAAGAAELLRRWIGGVPKMSRVSDLMRLIAVAVAATALVGATIGTATVHASLGGAAGRIWATWWVADLLGIIVVAPLILAWSSADELFSGIPIRRRAFELSLLLAGQSTVLFVITRIGEDGLVVARHPMLPFLLWAALRLGPRGTTISFLLLACEAVAITIQGRGPFGTLEIPFEQRIQGLQLLLIVVGVSVLTLSAVTAERAVAFARLQRSEARLKAAQSLARLGTWEYDTRTDSVYWSDEMCRLFHRDPAHPPPGRADVLAMIHPDDRNLSTSAAAEVVGNGGSLTYEFRTNPEIGPLRYLTTTKERIELRPDGTALLGGVVQDVTELHRLQQDFHQIRKMEAVGRLAGGVAHDFNNLLAVINGHAAAILDGEAPAESHRMLVGEIRRAGQQAADLTRQLLMFSRRETVSVRSLDLNDVIRGMEPMLRRLVGNGIALSIELHMAPLTVRADKSQIEQVLLNLAVNARDAMPDGGELRLRTSWTGRRDELPAGCSAADAGPWAILEVTDTGCGIDESMQSQIFEPFFTTKPPGLGTGLGLATVYGIVRQGRGHIAVRSRPGEGSTFEIRLPCAGNSPSAAPAEPFLAPRTDAA